jgi:hypothetical protein
MMKNVKHAGFTLTVPRLMVKLTPADFEARRGAVAETVIPVLHVTPIFAASASLCCTRIVLVADTAVVLTTHVPVDAATAHEKTPELALPQVTKDGLADVPIGEAQVFPL